MNFCINPKSEQVVALANELGLSANVTAAKVGHWMKTNNTEELPTKVDIIRKDIEEYKNGNRFKGKDVLKSIVNTNFSDYIDLITPERNIGSSTRSNKVDVLKVNKKNTIEVEEKDRCN